MYILAGLQNGLRVGADRSKAIRPALSNMLSAQLHRQVVADYIESESRRGQILGPFLLRSFLQAAIQSKRIGVIPKGQTGKWRLITDLSYLPGHSVNDPIDSHNCSLTYSAVDGVTRQAVALGAGAMMAKVDIESACRLVPVHVQDRPLLRLQWEGALYVDAMLPFGLRSAPKIFNAIADAIQWVAEQEGVEYTDHYLDDFIVWGSPGSPQCQRALETLRQVCAHLGTQLVPHKTVSPTTCLAYMGIIIDTVANELRLPPEKLARLNLLLAEWGDRKACS